ncbi:MAG: DNA-directed RNA polymerase subunit alpha [Nitrospirae bacterium]|nr:DNA-directed RNA polymerase subunit alpha [Nitrospirota bacterium]MBF0534287.1 DNA-directed RNA polymerase subunit alpha [Nitrospirota bacterium]MBF0615732.1 DNA-directed RNA polymerase subunit alpha [Nitrospirota bacterium]
MFLENSGFQLPENVYLEEETYSQTYGKLIAEPLERGYGITIGNALRRVLLSSIEGAAITSVKIDGVFHEFSTVKGVKEDVVEIILNLKKLRFKLHSDGEIIARINVSGKREVTAQDIEADSVLELLNTDAHIATLDDDAEFVAELTIDKGRGYKQAEDLKKEGAPIGFIAIDAVFTPIKKVVLNVEKTRVGKATDYDKLILEIWTDGNLSPKEAVSTATAILIKHMGYFSFAADVVESAEQENVSEDEPVVERAEAGDEPAVYQNHEQPVSSATRDLYKNLVKTVDELEFSVRSQNCLKNADVKYIYDLVQRSDNEMLKMKNFGKKSLDEIRDVLLSLGLDFNMKIDMDLVKKELLAKNGGK